MSKTIKNNTLDKQLATLNRIPPAIRGEFKTAWATWFVSLHSGTDKDAENALGRINRLLDQNPNPSLAELETAMKG